MHVHRSAPAWLVLASALSALSGCGFEPTHGTLEHSLSAATLTTLEEEQLPHVAPQIVGALELYFGTPAQPAFLVTEEWADDGYNPNWPTWPDDEDGSGEFTEEELEAIYADNERAFSRELRLIESGEHNRIKGFRTAPSLDEKWDRLVARLGAEGDDALSAEEFKAEAKDLLIGFYPQLRDSAELYRQQCLHCHGVSGGGDGPTAEYLNPRPRDYRKGVFKFTAVKDKARPRRADLFRILVDGVKGTAMPPFRRFSDAQIHGLADYVRLLAIRGEVESLTTLEVVDAGKLIPTTLQQTYADVWEKWNAAEESFFFFDGEIPPVTDERLARGKEIFMSPTLGNCQSCHGDAGMGNGPAAIKVDPETDKPLIGPDGKPVSAYEDDWGHPIYPRNLTQRVFRGGDRPIDIYRRVYAGINGTPMPGIGEAKDANGDPLLSDDDMWSLVHYVKSLSNGADQRIVVVHDEHEAGGHGGGHGEESHGDSHGGDHGEGQ